ncbi:MAG TPA: papain-like cysteine protease family protein, partial [Bryobacteraceae bacterium]|nr:papain-like cysteine protease family protein [Bryobacteraceae bacterium]
SGQGGNSPGNTGGHTGGQEAAGPRGGNSPANSGGHTGGDGPGSGCCCPVVIGPIVISNCCSSSADPSGDPPDPPAQQISLIPPADVEATPRARAFLMQNQGESDWCWAAVAVSINNFLDPQPNATTVGAAPTWTQGQLATQLLAQEMQWDPPVDCSVDPNLRCDKTAALDVALTITKNLMDGGARFNEYLDFASIQKWLDLQLPIGARIVWPNGGAHFIALSGYQTFANGEQKVMVEDPLYGTSLQDYSSLLGQYVHYGTWQDTYLVQP